MATAQAHQSPQGFRKLAGLGTTTARAVNLGGGILGGEDLGTSIITPGREGSQLSAPPPKLVSTQTANDGGEGQPLVA